MEHVQPTPDTRRLGVGCVALVVLAVLACVGVGLIGGQREASAGGGTWLLPDFAPGETVWLGAENVGLVPLGSDRGWVDDEPFDVWLRPSAQAQSAGWLSPGPDAIKVAQLELSEGSFDGMVNARTSFVVPDLVPGHYDLMICNADCEQTLGDLVGGNLRIVTPRDLMDAGPSRDTVGPDVTSTAETSTVADAAGADAGGAVGGGAVGGGAVGGGADAGGADAASVDVGSAGTKASQPGEGGGAQASGTLLSSWVLRVLLALGTGLVVGGLVWWQANRRAMRTESGFAASGAVAPDSPGSPGATNSRVAT